MRAFVQKGKEGDPNYFNLEQTAYGFWERGYEVIRFAWAELIAGDWDEDLSCDPERTILSGGVGTVREALSRLNHPAPELYDLPEILQQWIGRKFWSSTMGEIRSMVGQSSSGLPLHVKPLTDGKKFTGLVINEFRDLISTSAIDDELPVLVQETIEFISEWRAYILRGKIVNVSYYKGDPLQFPNRTVMLSALTAFEQQPISCSMDWGITTSGKTILVEVNDGFALGNYGINQSLYTAMIESRWRQMTGLNDNLVGVSH